jgi:hypothetical protein
MFKNEPIFNNEPQRRARSSGREKERAVAGTASNIIKLMTCDVHVCNTRKEHDQVRRPSSD